MTKRAWKTTEVEYLRQHYVEDGADAVAKALGRTRNSVVHAASTYGASRQHQAATLEGIKARCVTEGDCWLWQGASDGHGRANMRRDGRSVPVRRAPRRLSWWGSRPTSLEAPFCCRRDALAQNMRARCNNQALHCPQTAEECQA